MIPNKTVKDIYINVATQLTKDEQAWKHFISLGGRLTNHSYGDLLLIYYQNKNATTVKTVQEWQKEGISINDKAKGITLFEKSTTGYDTTTVYDRSETDSDSTIRENLFRSSEQNKETIRKLYQETFQRPLEQELEDTALIELIDYGISFYAEKDPSGIIKKNLPFISDSVAYVIGENMPTLKQPIEETFSTKIKTISIGMELNVIGTIITNVSQQLTNHLIEIKAERMKEEEKHHDRKNHSILQRERGRSTTTGLREDGERLPRRESTVQTRHLDDEWRVDELSSLSGGKSNRGRTDDDTRSAEKVSLSDRSERASTREAPTSINQPSSGNRDSQLNSTTQSTRIIPKKEEDEQHRSLPFDFNNLPDKDSTTYVTEMFEFALKRGSLIEDGKLRINEYFQRQLGMKERIDFLKKEYGFGGFSIPDYPTVNWDNKSFSISFNKELPHKYSWKIVSDTIEQLIYQGTYLSEKEREEYYERFLPTRTLTTIDLNDSIAELANHSSIANLGTEQHEQAVEQLCSEKMLRAHTTHTKFSFSEEGIVITIFGNHKEFPLTWEELTEKVQRINPKKNIVKETEELSLFDFIDENSSPETPSKEVSKQSSFKVEEAKNNYYLSGLSSTQYSEKKREKFQDNVQAIRLLNELEKEERQANPKEQAILARFSGWGGLQEAFDERNSSWEKEVEVLKELLPETEYVEARKSVLTAFYTSNEVIKEMYYALNKMGEFSNKTILDAGMGTGNFFMNLPDRLQTMHKIGIEIDPITSKIAKQLFPNEELYAEGYETVLLKEKVDLVVGNVPFNDISVRDKKYDSFNFRIHDYFLAKSIDQLKENGLMMVITSSSTMDKKNSKAREYLAKRATLVGAVRLPKTAFKQVAGTEVISDILIFQKKSIQQMMNEEELPTWVHSSSHPDYEGLMMNRYFINQPEQILGTIQVKNFHGQTLDVLPTSMPLSVELNEGLERIIENKTFAQTKQLARQSNNPAISVPEQAKPDESLILPENARNYSFITIGSSIVYHRQANDFDVIPKGNKHNKIAKMIEVKDTLNNVIEIQQRAYEEQELKQALSALNTAYDTFTSRYGYFNEKGNSRDFRMDDQYPLLLSIEKEQENTYVKQDIFFKATIRPTLQLTTVDSASKALELSLAKKSVVDFDFMQERYPTKSKDEIIEELGTKIFLNPRKVESAGYYHAWESSDAYLTGEVKGKLAVSKIAYEHERDPKRKELYQLGVSALEKAQPEPLQAGDIDFQLGSTWIPTKYYNHFMYELLEVSSTRQGTKNNSIYIEKIDFNSSWKIHGYYRNSTNVLQTKTFGTSRKNAFELIENSLNLQKAKVSDKIIDPETNKEKYVLNPEETMLAREKQEEIESVFQQWLFSDSERRTTLVNLYNEQFNTIVPRTYDGSSLIFDDMNLQMELRPHQKDVVARILYSGTALMAHEVGAGKTAAMLTAGMYLKQNQLINKPLYVVPNHLTEQWGKEILMFYPSANVLVTTKKDFEKQNRKAFVSKIATGNYDAIIIGHSQFERIPLSKERQLRNLQHQLDETLQFISEAKEEEGQKFTVKQIEKYRETLKNKFDKLKNEEKKDDLLTFEQLGVDFLFVDEAHAYKNLFVYTKMTNVAGVGKSNSQRATDMLDKVRYIQEKHDGKNVVFATGTPISNSMSELYVMQHFLQPEELQRRGLRNFDAWASTFGQVVSSLEITPEASGYRLRDRFKKFHNLPELMNTFNLVADIQTADMLDLPVPDLQTGKVQTIIAEKSAFQNNMMDEFVVRSEAIRQGLVDPHTDNMLKLTHEAKLMAIDSRLIDDSQPRDPESKISLCCERVYSIWEESKEARSTQMIFSDAGTPKKGVFNVYDEIKTQLIEKGIPEKEIAFIHDAKTDPQRDILFSKMKSGEIRVLLGSTQKLGTGTNVQHKLLVAHHIDCPWKPSDLTQREGGILRQGNENKEVQIYRYITKGTFDSYLWQIQEQKLTYISQVMTGKSISRSCEDLDETVLSASEVKAVATENPLLAEKMTLDNEVSRLQLLRSRWESQRSKLDQDIRITYPNKLASLTSDLNKIATDIDTLTSTSSEEFSMHIDGKLYTDKTEAFEEIYARVQLAPNSTNGQVVVSCGEYRGLTVQVQRNDYRDDLLILSGEHSYQTTFTPSTGVGNITRLMNLSGRAEAIHTRKKEEIKDTEKQIEQAKLEVEKPFSKQEELTEKIARQRQLTKQIELDTLKQSKNVTKQVQQSI